ncbi:EAL domain-containing protein [Kineococcus sp. SYSU DK005]|uniref:EAL domain-containing protein n=1 Tax=Kineococcus sp. SYSU DK005 TaxID=3383126 RepID=UPI003D7D4FE2
MQPVPVAVVDFASAARATLQRLHQRMGMDTWAIARRDGQDYVVLSALDTAHVGLHAGDVMRWCDTFCAAALSGDAPRFSTQVQQVPAWQHARRATGLPWRSYLSVPLTGPDGTVLGSLCAGAREQVDAATFEQLADVELAAELLGTVLAYELRLQHEARRAEHAEAAAERDALTGLGNRRAWAHALAGEEARARPLGSSASVLVIDLDELKRINDTHGHQAGDALLVRTAQVLREQLRPDQLAVRLGGDEFAVLLPDSDRSSTAAVIARLRAALRAAQVRASLGAATRRATEGLQEAWHQADAAMYADKAARASRARSTSRRAPGLATPAAAGSPPAKQARTSAPTGSTATSRTDSTVGAGAGAADERAGSNGAVIEAGALPGAAVHGARSRVPPRTMPSTGRQERTQPAGSDGAPGSCDAREERADPAPEHPAEHDADVRLDAPPEVHLDAPPEVHLDAPDAAGPAAHDDQHSGARIGVLLQAARQQLGMDAVIVTRFDGEDWRVQHTATAPGAADPRGLTCRRAGTYCQRVLDGALPAVIADTGAHPVTATLPLTGVLGIGAYVGVPLHLSDGPLHGSVCALSRAPRPDLDRRDAAVLAVLAEALREPVTQDQQRLQRRHYLLTRLEQLQLEGGPRPVYQPIIDLRTLRPIGREALSRFPDAGPSEWFAAAADVGAGIDLELAALRAALTRGVHGTSAFEAPQDLHDPHDVSRPDAVGAPPETGCPGGAGGGGFLAVNVSPALAASPDLAHALHGQALRRLVVEITEHEQVQDYAALLRHLQPLREQGLRLAVDDAGAGFASMRHVLALKPDFIKLDMSLIHDIHHDQARQAMTGALVTFAHRSAAHVIAEGIESAEELACLRELGVCHGQGYHLGRPAA